MVSSDQEALATRRLAQWLGNDKRIVSREIGCHVNAAKNILLGYLNDNDSLEPTYVLTGTLKPTSHLAETTLDPSAPPSPKATQSFAHLSATQGVRIVDMDEMSDADRNSEPDLDEGSQTVDQGASAVKVDLEEEEGIVPDRVATWGVVIVQADHLEEKKALFEPEGMSITIYALSPAPVKDPAQYLIPELSVRAHKAYFKPEVYGTLTGDAFQPAQAVVMKDGGIDWAKKPVKDDKKVEPPKAEKKKEVPKTTAKKEEGMGKKQVDIKPNIEEVTASKPAAKSAKPATKQRKRVIESDDEEEEEPVESPAARSSVAKATPVKEPTSSLTRQEDQVAMEAMMDMDFDMSDGDEPKRPTVKKDRTEVGHVIKVKTEPGQRKRRKVKKSKKVMEGKYMVTQDYWSEESYSGESEPESQPKAAAPAKPAPPKKAEPPKALAKPASKPPAPAKGGQATLMGFFKKK